MSELHFILPTGFKGRITSDSPLEFGLDQRLLLEAYVPGISFKKSAAPFDMTINHRESARRAACFGKGEIILDGAWGGVPSMDMYHLLYSVTREHYVQNGMFPVHAACVGRDDDDGLESRVLLVGHSGSGKTSVALGLTRRGWKFFSGNKTVVRFSDEGRVDAVAGTKTITGVTGEMMVPSGSLEYGGRSAVRYADEEYLGEGGIDAIVLVRLSDGRRECERMNPLSALHSLYPFFLDAVNADTIVCGRYVYDGRVSAAAKERLAQGLERALENLPVYKMTGAVGYIADRIGGMDI